MRQAGIDRGQAGPRDQGLLSSEERAELNRLRKMNRELRREKACVPCSGVIPPAPPPRRSRGGPRTSGDRLYGCRCKGWAGPFPWFEYHLNQTDHAQDPLCRT